jgi:N-acetylmuramoyl-L-alanine amidase
MKFISSGHCNVKGPNYDPGAPGVNNRWEANETVKVRNRVIAVLQEKGITDIIQDADGERLSQYLTRIKTGSGSMVCEFHFNANQNPEPTGTETLVEDDADKMDMACAKEFCDATSRILGIKNRGVKKESTTRHKKLALMREEGIVVLVEICFISNQSDMARFDLHFEELCQAYAAIIQKYDEMVS